MRIKIVQKPKIAEADGIRLDLFEVGFQYEVGNFIGGLLLAEGWAVPVASDEPGVVIPLDDAPRAAGEPRNLIRLYRSDQQEPAQATAAEKPRPPRRSHAD